MIVKDCHTHSGGFNYKEDKIYAFSSITGYQYKMKALKELGIHIDSAVTFSQPSPYPFLTKKPWYNIVDYSKKNDEIGKKCLSLENMLFACFVDPRLAKAPEEISRCVKKYDAQAIKIHLSAATVNVEILEYNGIVKTAEEYDLPLIVHMNPKDCEGIKQIAEKNMDVKFIIAHIAYLQTDFFNLVKKFDNVFFDTSAFVHENFKYSMVASIVTNKDFNSEFAECLNPKLGEKDKINLKEIKIDYNKMIELVVEMAGSNNFLFGSDEGWSPLEEQIRIINESNISSSDKENIFYKNFNKIFNK